MTAAQIVYQISRAILAERDGFVAVIKMFVDESGTHDGSPVVTVGAYLGKAKSWRDFTKEWNFRKRPVRVFHAVDCASLRGEFKGWTSEKRDAYVAQLLPVLSRHGLVGLVFGINLKAFENALAPHPELRKIFGTPYTACFHWTMLQLVELMEERNVNDTVAIFHECNDYQQEVLRIFNYVKQHRRFNRSVLSLSFGTKDDYVPLQAADIMAYEGNKRLRDVSRPRRRALEAIDPDRNRLIVGYYGEENMPQMIQRMSSFVADAKAGMPLPDIIKKHDEINRLRRKGAN